MTRNAVFHSSGVYDDGSATLSIQPGDADLTEIAALTPTNDDIIQRKAGAWTNRSMAQLGGDLTATGLWVPYSVIDAKGDLLVGSANDALDNLAVGSDGKVLMADAASTLGVKWETPASGGVSSINKTGSTALTGAVTLTGGTNVTLTQSGQDISIAASGSGALSSVDATISGDVTMTTAGTFYDGPSGTFAAGTWFIVWKLTLAAPSANGQAYTGRLWDGTTTYDESETDIANPGAGGETVFGGQAIVVLGGSATLKVSATSARNTTIIKRDVLQGSATSHTASRLSGIKIA